MAGSSDPPSQLAEPPSHTDAGVCETATLQHPVHPVWKPDSGLIFVTSVATRAPKTGQEPWRAAGVQPGQERVVLDEHSSTVVPASIIGRNEQGPTASVQYATASLGQFKQRIAIWFFWSQQARLKQMKQGSDTWEDVATAENENIHTRLKHHNKQAKFAPAAKSVIQ
ncbi:hypothetical protein L916_17626 [Phytophthora nicotianae]|uniref:Uncharacterized protein n=1 Tax=Phytophthora nicotianae TaxID=4792 RepID=W2I4H5_PHYNI|nr:hypothetical protein L916_17626 [Phytophthora nicotianae]